MGSESIRILSSELVVPPPEQENVDFGYFDSPPQRRLQTETAGDGHSFKSILTSRNGDVFVNWQAALPQPGRYEVAVFVPGTHATTRAARYFVHGIVGRDDPAEAIVNQSLHFDAWVPLGIYEFDPLRNSETFVDAQNVSVEQPPQEIAFDAVRWRLIPEGAEELTWIWPVLDEPHIIGHPFNEPRPSFGANKLHEGVDLRAGLGARIVAAVPGTVKKLHRWNPPNRRGADAYGNHVIIEQTPGGYEVLYAHFNDFAPGLREGQQIAQGQVIGFAGSTGNSTAAHLHVTVAHPIRGLDGYVFPKVLDPTAFLLGTGGEGTSSGGAIEPGDAAIVGVSNQAVVNQLFKIAPELGLEGWPLIERLGWQDLAVPSPNRNLAFERNRLNANPGGVSEADWSFIRQKVEELYQALQFARMPEGLRALPGVHGPADPGDFAWIDRDRHNIKAVQQSGVEAVKVLVPEIQAETIRQLAALPRVRFILARLFCKLDASRGATMAERVEFFLSQVDPVAAGANGPLARVFNAGVRYFEVHSEPNLTGEGLFSNWRDGREFADFFIQVAARLRNRYRGARFGFPGLSPGPDIPGRRAASERFLSEAAAALRDADFLGTHVYWGGDGSTVADALRELDAFLRAHPDKIVLLTEFSNNAQGVSKDAKGDQYREFYQGLKNLPPNLGAAFAFCLSSTGEFQHETWVEKGGGLSGIFGRLGLQ
jgi:murein DD-endopeptidase MepM/ murein hydrolase activator NlpD